MQIQLFTVREENAFLDCLTNLLFCPFFQTSGFFLLITNDILDRLGLLCEVLSFDVLADLHGAFQCLEVICLCKHDDNFFTLALRH